MAVKFSKKQIIIAAVIVVLVVFRLLLPAIVLRYVNKTLAGMDGYYGRVKDIGISLYRGAYQINDMYLNKVDSASGEQTPFFNAENIDLSVEWKALIHGSLTGELELNSPELIFTKDKAEIQDVQKDTTDFRKLIKDFMPLKINRFEVNNGRIHYRDNTTSPKVDVSLRQTHILATNLKNAEDSSTALPSTVVATANAYDGSLSFNMKLDALAEHATFDFNAEIKEVNLVKLNDFIKAYSGVDVNKGTFGLYTEFASKNGRYKGYVKPIIKNMDVLGPEDRNNDLLHKMWEGIVGAAGKLLNNPEENQVATKVPIEGALGKSSTNIVEVIWELLKNAFIQALVPSIDHEISLQSVDKEEEKDEKDKKGFFQRIFGKKDKNDKDNEDDSKEKDKEK